MNIDKLEKITLAELKKLFELNELSIKDALPLLREFQDKHALSDRQALHARKIAARIFGE